jgi:hypothetical protein
MKTLSTAAKAAIVAGDALVGGAVEITPLTGAAIPLTFTEGAPVVLTWEQASFDQNLTGGGSNDQAHMGIAFFDSSGTQIGSTVWATLTDISPPMVFQSQSLSTTVPAACATIRLYQEMNRRTGTNNDGYIDSIVVTVDGVALDVVNPGAEDAGPTGWINEAGGLAVRQNDPAAPEGMFYFTGGASALTRAYQDISAGFEIVGGYGTPLRLWSGYGSLEIGGNAFDGIGAAGLAQQNGSAIGGVAQGMTLSLSGIEPDVLAMLDDADQFKGASVVVYRLIFDNSGKNLLDAHVFDRGRLDTIQTDETIGSTATISCAVESAARSLGRSGARMRSDSDQRLISSSDGYFKGVAYAGQKELYWGGKIPVSTGDTHGGVVAGTAGGTGAGF